MIRYKISIASCCNSGSKTSPVSLQNIRSVFLGSSLRGGTTLAIRSLTKILTQFTRQSTISYRSNSNLHHTTQRGPPFTPLPLRPNALVAGIGRCCGLFSRSIVNQSRWGHVTVRAVGHECFPAAHHTLRYYPKTRSATITSFAPSPDTSASLLLASCKLPQRPCVCSAKTSIPRLTYNEG